MPGHGNISGDSKRQRYVYSKNKKLLLIPFVVVAIVGPSFPASAILSEDNINGVTGLPILDQSLYTNLGNQPRFDDVVSFTITDISSGGVPSAPTAYGSGVLIAPNVVLTSAHLVDDLAQDIFVAKGYNALTSTEDGNVLIGGALGPSASTSSQTFSILNWTVHPSWNPLKETGTDLAVVEVASSHGLNPINTYNRSGVSESV